MLTLILLLIALLAITAIGVWLCNMEDAPFIAWVLAWLCLCVGIVGLIGYTVLVFSYAGSESKARIINAEFGTTYTRDDLFYNGDFILAFHGVSTNDTK